MSSFTAGYLDTRLPSLPITTEFSTLNPKDITVLTKPSRSRTSFPLSHPGLWWVSVSPTKCFTPFR